LITGCYIIRKRKKEEEEDDDFSGATKFIFFPNEMMLTKERGMEKAKFD